MFSSSKIKPANNPCDYREIENSKDVFSLFQDCYGKKGSLGKKNKITGKDVNKFDFYFDKDFFMSQLYSRNEPKFAFQLLNFFAEKNIFPNAIRDKEITKEPTIIFFYENFPSEFFNFLNLFDKYLNSMDENNNYGINTPNFQNKTIINILTENLLNNNLQIRDKAREYILTLLDFPIYINVDSVANDGSTPLSNAQLANRNFNGGFEKVVNEISNRISFKEDTCNIEDCARKGNVVRLAKLFSELPPNEQNIVFNNLQEIALTNISFKLFNFLAKTISKDMNTYQYIYDLGRNLIKIYNEHGNDESLENLNSLAVLLNKKNQQIFLSDLLFYSLSDYVNNFQGESLEPARILLNNNANLGDAICKFENYAKGKNKTEVEKKFEIINQFIKEYIKDMREEFENWQPKNWGGLCFEKFLKILEGKSNEEIFKDPFLNCISTVLSAYQIAPKVSPLKRGKVGPPKDPPPQAYGNLVNERKQTSGIEQERFEEGSRQGPRVLPRGSEEELDTRLQQSVRRRPHYTLPTESSKTESSKVGPGLGGRRKRKTCKKRKRRTRKNKKY
jgi:hypothetical protein